MSNNQCTRTRQSCYSTHVLFPQVKIPADLHEKIIGLGRLAECESAQGGYFLQHLRIPDSPFRPRCVRAAPPNTPLKMENFGKPPSSYLREAGTEGNSMKEISAKNPIHKPVFQQRPDGCKGVKTLRVHMSVPLPKPQPGPCQVVMYMPVVPALRCALQIQRRC